MTADNAYVTRTDFLNWIYAQTAVLAVDDLVIDEILEQTSRYCDDTTGRHFYPIIKTRLFDVPWDDTLLLTDDLLAVLILTNGDSTIISTNNYNLLSVNAPPYWGIRISDIASIYWTGTATGSSQQVISVNGIWGYHPDYALQAWSVATTLNGAITDTTGLVWNVVSGASLAKGNIVRIDNELLIVDSVAVNAVTFVARGDNGSTAATHLTGATVYLWNTYKTVRSAAFQIAQSIYKRRHGESLSGLAQVTAAGVVVTPKDIPELAERQLLSLTRLS